jgi:hypothetical protein
MPNPLKILSPPSLVVGLAGAGGLLWFLYPWEAGTAIPLGLGGFVVTAGLCEAIVRLTRKPAP